jgi:hypothetical protein
VHSTLSGIHLDKILDYFSDLKKKSHYSFYSHALHWGILIDSLWFKPPFLLDFLSFACRKNNRNVGWECAVSKENCRNVS